MRWRLPLYPYEWKLKWIDGAYGKCNDTKSPGILEWLRIKRKVDLTKERTLVYIRKKLTGIYFISDSRITLGVREPASNMISTHIYSPLFFLPIFVYSQFRQFANLVFLILSIIQIFPGLSPFGKQSTMVPLITIMTISAIRELYEDVMRRYRDNMINDQKAWAHTDQGWKSIQWKKIHVGQLIRIDEGDQIPCDVLLISSSEPAGVTYIQTANLDGESNLKIRQALPETAHLNNDTAVETLWNSGSSIVCEPPNRKIHEFEGYFGNASSMTETTSTKRIPLSAGHLLLRGARLKNTQFAYGISLYTGKYTKLMMNSSKKTLKRSAIFGMTNAMMCIQFGICVLLALVVSCTRRVSGPLDFLFAMFGDGTQPMPVIVRGMGCGAVGPVVLPVVALNDGPSKSPLHEALYITFLCSVVLMNGFVPISLYVTLEVVQTIQAYFIKSDMKLMDENGKGADVKIFSLNSDLGRVRYVMSDKTGTLTQNCMRFRQCSIGGIKYANKENRRNESFNTARLKTDMASNERENGILIRDFLVACGVCHTVTPEPTNVVRPIYHCTSPDESALVSTAADAGFTFLARTGNALTVDVNGTPVKYAVLALLEFTSDRKRMSMVVQADNEPIKLYVKGADHMIMDRLSENQNAGRLKRTRRHLRSFATRGLRTLCFAMRTLTAEQWADVSVIYKEAECALNKKTALMARVADLLEKDLELIGVSGIEDRLQDEVPETIEKMLEAGIRLWILTGDKLETAVNIARETVEETRKDLDAFMAELGTRLEDRNHQLALIVDAVCLDFLLSEDFELDFLRLALSCSAVICCRCTPMQKATVTKLVKQSVDGAVLSIGDGANDVAMIQEADVGVGLSGQEGMQASIAADYTVSQFRHLNRLLFVHGTLSLFRTSKCINYSIYKNVLESMLFFYFTFLNGRSDQPIADSWTIVRYNMCFTSFTALAIGTMDRPAVLSEMESQIYLYQKYDGMINLWSLCRWYYGALVHSFVIIFILISSWGDGVHNASNGISSTLWMMGCVAYTQLVTVANIKALLETKSITSLAVWSFCLSIFLFYAGLLWDSLTWQWISFQEPHMGDILFHYPIFHSFFVLLLTLVVCFTFDIIQKLYSSNQVLDGEPLKRLYAPIVKLVDLVGRRMGHLEPGRNGFAFAQDDGCVVTQSQLIQQHCSNTTTSSAHSIKTPFNTKPSFVEEDRSAEDRTVEPQSIDLNRSLKKAE